MKLIHFHLIYYLIVIIYLWKAFDCSVRMIYPDVEPSQGITRRVLPTASPLQPTDPMDISSSESNSDSEDSGYDSDEGGLSDSDSDSSADDSPVDSSSSSSSSEEDLSDSSSSDEDENDPNSAINFSGWDTTEAEDNDPNFDRAVYERNRQKRAQLRQTYRAGVVNRSFALFETYKTDYLRPVRKYWRDDSRGEVFGTFEEWMEAADTYNIKDPVVVNDERHGRMSDWVFYYSIVYCLQRRDFDHLELVMNYLMDVPISEEVKIMMRGGPEGQYKSILVLLEEALYVTKARKRQRTEIRAKFRKLLFGLKSFRKVYGARKDSHRLLTLERAMEMNDKTALYYAITQFKKKKGIKKGRIDAFPFKVLRFVIKQDWIDIAHIFLIEFMREFYRDVSKRTQKRILKRLANEKLYKNAKSVKMVKMLQSKMVPILSKKGYQTRSYFYDIENQNERAGILEMIKKNNDNSDSSAYSRAMGVHMRKSLLDLIKIGSKEKVKAYFLREDIDRTDKSVILAGIKQNCPRIVKTLLNERMSLPSQAEMEANYKEDTRKGEVIMELIEEYKKYYDNDGNPLLPVEQSYQLKSFVLSFPRSTESSITASIPSIENSNSSDYEYHECKFFKDLVRSKRAGETNLLSTYSEKISKWLNISL